LNIFSCASHLAFRCLCNFGNAFFCAACVQSGYLRDLEQVYDHYLELLAAGTKELKGTVYSADKLDDSEMSSVRAAIMKSMVCIFCECCVVKPALYALSIFDNAIFCLGARAHAH
jgi:hypothetical protein